MQLSEFIVLVNLHIFGRGWQATAFVVTPSIDITEFGRTNSVDSSRDYRSWGVPDRSLSANIPMPELRKFGLNEEISGGVRPTPSYSQRLASSQAVVQPQVSGWWVKLASFFSNSW